MTISETFPSLRHVLGRSPHVVDRVRVVLHAKADRGPGNRVVPCERCHGRSRRWLQIRCRPCAGTGNATVWSTYRRPPLNLVQRGHSS